MTDKWKALERLRMRVAGGNHADEDCNIINRAFRDLEQRVEQLETEGCGQCEACEDFFPLLLLNITDDGVALCLGDWDEVLAATAELAEEEA